MTSRRNISSNSPLESRFGYSRATRVGNMVFVSGTTSVQPDGSVAGGDDAYLQTKAALATIEKALIEAGASFTDVVRTRLFLTNFDDLSAVSKAHVEIFGDIRPASTAVEISRLARIEQLIEIEADAFIE